MSIERTQLQHGCINCMHILFEFMATLDELQSHLLRIEGVKSNN